jgi:FtsZ-binding cell division protein ZapB
MLRRVMESFRQGIGRIKWFSSVVSARLKIEIAIIKLLQRSDAAQKQREELIRTIGERVCELGTNRDRNVFRDRTIQEALNTIEGLEKEIEELNRRVQDVTSAGI